MMSGTWQVLAFVCSNSRKPSPFPDRKIPTPVHLSNSRPNASPHYGWKHFISL